MNSWTVSAVCLLALWLVPSSHAENDEAPAHDQDFYVAKRPFGGYVHDASKGSIGSNLDLLQDSDEFEKRLFKFGKRPFGSMRGTYKFGKREPVEEGEQAGEAGDWTSLDEQKRRSFKFGRRGTDRRTVYFGKRGEGEGAQDWADVDSDLYDRMQRAAMFKFGKRQQ